MFQITLWSTIVFLGVVGNLLVCFVILSQAKMKTSMNYYLLSLATADLGVLLIVYPMAVLKYLFPFRWLLGKQACYYLYPTVEVFFGASVWSITAHCRREVSQYSGESNVTRSSTEVSSEDNLWSLEWCGWRRFYFHPFLCTRLCITIRLLKSASQLCQTCYSSLIQ